MAEQKHGAQRGLCNARRCIKKAFQALCASRDSLLASLLCCVCLAVVIMLAWTCRRAAGVVRRACRAEGAWKPAQVARARDTSRCFARCCSSEPARSIPTQLPSRFPRTHSLGELVLEHQDLEPGSRARDVSVCVAGRVTAKRAASSKLVFLDLTADGVTVQVRKLLSHNQCRGSPVVPAHALSPHR